MNATVTIAEEEKLNHTHGKAAEFLEITSFLEINASLMTIYGMSATLKRPKISIPVYTLVMQAHVPQNFEFAWRIYKCGLAYIGIMAPYSNRDPFRQII